MNRVVTDANIKRMIKSFRAGFPRIETGDINATVAKALEELLARRAILPRNAARSAIETVGLHLVNYAAVERDREEAEENHAEEH